VASDMSNVLSIDWTPVDNEVPFPYLPDVSGIPYFYLKAQMNSYYNRILEVGETTALTDNFFYTVLNINIPKLPDLQVTSLTISNTILENHPYVVEAAITNLGDTIIVGKTRTDGIWRSKEPNFNTATASLIATKNTDNTLEPDASYTVSFDLIAPSDSLTSYYYFVETDITDNVYESDETNNRRRSDIVTILPYLLDENDYDKLLYFFTAFGGENWIIPWETSSIRIRNNWPGVTIKEGRVTNIALPSNNLTGEISEIIYDFPYLTSLNLYDNQISGTIPASISNQTYLENLNLSHNQLTGIENVLSENIVQLNIQYQLFGADSIILSSQPMLNIPSIAHYDHANRNFDFYPSYGLYISNERILGYSPNSDHYNWEIQFVDERDFEWRYDSGTEFTLIQENGLTFGSSSTLKINFDAGDANIDRAVDILDVQHSLNYIFSEHTSAFNFAAADTYKDSVITIQDLIKTINIVLDFDANVASPSLRSSFETNNRLYIEAGKLILYTEQPVAAMDITLRGISDNDVSLVLNTAFQLMSRNTADGTRLIAFSPLGDAIPPGNTVIAELYKNDATLVKAILSGREAKYIPINLISSGGTGEMFKEIENIKVRVNAGLIDYYLPENVDNIIATLYSIQGSIVGKQELNNLSAGKYNLDFNANYPGIYILNLIIKKGDRSISKNYKLIF
jgi:hypothetical protein